LEIGGEHDRELASDLARLGHGEMAAVRDHRQVAAALSRFLS